MTEMYSVYKRQRILHYERTGHKEPTIFHLLREEGMRVSHVFAEVQGNEEDGSSSEGVRRVADEGRL